MATEAWLIENGFRHVGEWDVSRSRLHRVDWLKRQAGVYAFVVNSEVRYIGKANALHRRLRNYLGRAFGPATGRAPRRVHVGIRQTVECGSTVAVFARIVDPSGSENALQVESRLIREVRPLWNGPEQQGL